MKVTLPVAQLQEVMDLVSRFVSKHSTLPILENIYIKGNIDTIVFRATDMEKYIEIEIPAKLSDEWALTVNSKTLFDIIKAIDEEHASIVIEESKDLMTIKTASDEFKIKGIPASEYVAVPAVQSDHPVTLSTEAFSIGISKVEYAVTEKNFSPVLTGVFMRVKEYDGKKKLVFVGTDSFRLAEYKMDFSGSNVQNLALIVPKVHINDIKKVADYALDHGAQQMKTMFSENMVSFGFELKEMNVFTTSLLIQGTFPEYENENIMPTAFTTKVVFDKNDLDKAIRKISILTRDINNFINIQSDTDKLFLSSGETDLGEGQTSTAAVVDGDKVQFGVNGKYIGDFLRIVSSQEVTMRVINAEKPVIFKDNDDENYTYVVRPLIK